MAITLDDMEKAGADGSSKQLSLVETAFCEAVKALTAGYLDRPTQLVGEIIRNK